MSIQDVHNNNKTSFYTIRPTNNQNVSSSSVNPQDSNADSVNISKNNRSDSNMQKISDFKKHMDAEPDIRIEMVENLRERIRTNDYPIDQDRLDAIVQKMIEESSLLT